MEQVERVLCGVVVVEPKNASVGTSDQKKKMLWNCIMCNMEHSSTDTDYDIGERNEKNMEKKALE